MRYEFKGKKINIPDQEIEKSMKILELKQQKLDRERRQAVSCRRPSMLKLILLFYSGKRNPPLTHRAPWQYYFSAKE